MAFANVHSAQTTLLAAHTIAVESDTSKGFHAFSIVGLPDKAVEEAKDRISSAIKNSGFSSPKSKNQKIVISLAPADIKKEGPGFDVAMALAYLLASKECQFETEHRMFLGELSLNGEIKSLPGTLALALHAKKSGFKELYVPQGNAKEAALVSGIDVYSPKNLKELVEHLAGEKGERLHKVKKTILKQFSPSSVEGPDFTFIRGQEGAKRGLLIAGAGGHNIALYGPPGTGKTMLARAFTSILPPLAFKDALEVTSIHSIAGTLSSPLVQKPPFRSPHHTSSYVSIVGGGVVPKPGEVTLAHRGVLFLDEFPEFERRVIESLREPLEERAITVARARGVAHFPANFILIAALNPCPCGNFGGRKECSCSPIMLERYRKKISGPIMDRIDMWIEVGHIDHTTLSATAQRTESKRESEQLRQKVHSAREKQKKRFGGKQIALNSEMGVRELDTVVELTETVKEELNRAAQTLDLSPRSYHKIIKLARTIADLAGEEQIAKKHILEALQYRPRVWSV